MRRRRKYVVLAVTIETLLGLVLALLVVARAALRRLHPRRPDPADDDRAGGRRRDLAADLRVGHRHRQPARSRLLGLGAAERAGAQPTSAFIGVVVVDIWEWTPLLFLIILAGLQSMPQEPLEAARVDGAGRVRRLLRPHAAAAAAGAAGRRRAAHDRRDRHLRPDLRADQGRPRHRHPADLASTPTTRPSCSPSTAGRWRCWSSLLVMTAAADDRRGAADAAARRHEDRRVSASAASTSTHRACDPAGRAVPVLVDARHVAASARSTSSPASRSARSTPRCDNYDRLFDDLPLRLDSCEQRASW